MNSPLSTGTKRYCCIGTYYDVGHTADCPSGAGHRPVAKAHINEDDSPEELKRQIVVLRDEKVTLQNEVRAKIKECEDLKTINMRQKGKLDALQELVNSRNEIIKELNAKISQLQHKEC